jgi:ribosomal protein S18 acetylase RimI-like enzyme
MALEVRLADYHDPEDARLVLDLLDLYARDPMGGGEPLPEATRANLLPGLQQTPGAFSLIAALDGEPAGLANCFWGYSTFAAKPLINIHDVVVDPRFRGQGVAKALFARVEELGVERGACKVTLEVLSGNERAKALYASLGYGDFALDPAKGTALFWQKRLAA